MDAFLQLAEILEKESAHQRELLSLLTQERAAIVQLRQDELNRFQLEKQELIEKGRRLESQRDRLLQLIITDVQARENPKLSDVIANCPNQKIQSRLGNIREELKSLAMTTQDLNLRNSELIKHALGVLGATMSLAYSAGTVDTTPTYTRAGGLRDPLAARRRNRSSI